MAKNIKEKIIEIAKQIHDEADHIIGTEADDFNEVALIDLEAIRSLATNGLSRLFTKKNYKS
jgi:hypothetical protein